jgi:hypothetical protein
MTKVWYVPYVVVPIVHDLLMNVSCDRMFYTINTIGATSSA